MDRSQGRACQQPALDTGVARAQGLVVGVEEVVEVRLKHLVPGTWGCSTSVSTNQVVWARCHWVGLASGMGWMH